MTAVVTQVKIPAVAYTAQTPVSNGSTPASTGYHAHAVAANSQIPISNGSSPLSPVRSAAGGGGGTYGFSF